MQLSPTEITFLASCFAETNPLSPFVNNKKDPTGTEQADLEKKGVLASGELTDEAKELLSPLAAPQRCSRLILQKPFCLLEKYTYLNGEKLTLAESDGSGLVFTALEKDAQPVIDVLADFFPQSAIKSAEFDVTLSPSQTLVLLACIDLCRVRALSAYIGGSGADMSFTPEEAAAQLEGGFVNGLAFGLAGNCSLKMPESSTVPALITFLEQKGCVEPAKDKPGYYVLTPNYRLFASNFLIYDSLLLLEAFQLTGEGKVAASMDLCFCCGMHDIIAFSACPEGFQISSLSGAELRARMKDTLDCPVFDVK